MLIEEGVVTKHWKNERVLAIFAENRQKMFDNISH